MSKSFTMAILACGFAIAGCTVRDGSETNQSTNAAAAQSTNSGVVRDVSITDEAPVQPMPAATVIQSQLGPDGAQVDLLKVAVTGDVLTVTLRCSSSERVNSESFRVRDISVIDDATSQRIAVLKDNEGNWLASNVTGDNIGASCETKPGTIWAKFPAPAATSKTVSINLPEVAPFDGVPVTR